MPPITPPVAEREARAGKAGQGTKT